MHKHSLSLQMSQIIASDAPLLSPTDACWDNDAFAYYHLPPSPPLSDEAPSPAPATRMLRAPLSPELCVPTHQLFDFAEPPRPPTPPSRSPSLAARPSDDSDSACGRKRSASPSPDAPKKRSIGERISSKDFVPPDVSGLSKREARLVKNRAAAFLSRQRKREEFECMEVRVAELEQENARLLALAGGAPPPSELSEVEQLRAQLAAAKERERTLSAQLASGAPVKLEASEPFLFPSPAPRIPASKSGASLGLMVLLCALPSLLAMRMHPAPPTGFTIPNPFPSSASAASFDYASYLPAEYDWARGGPIDMDDGPNAQRLQFAGADDDTLAALGDLAVSFEASPADGRTIRVRIHPSSSSSGPSSSSSSSSASDASSSCPASPAPSPWDADPFLGAPDFAPFAPDGSLRYDYAALMHAQGGAGTTCAPMASAPGAQLPFGAGLDMDMDFNAGFGGMGFGAQSSMGFGSPMETSVGTGAARQRVRIALKSAPAAGGEGGEWEVRLC